MCVSYPLCQRPELETASCQTRDLLLPKLISGELNVFEIDIDVSKGK